MNAHIPNRDSQAKRFDVSEQCALAGHTRAAPSVARRGRVQRLGVLCVAAATVVVTMGAAGASFRGPVAAAAATPSPYPPIHTYRQQLGLAGALQSAAARVTLGGPYTYWGWSDAVNYSNFAQRITVQAGTTPNAPFFWSYQFTTTPDPDGFGGGYIGLQQKLAIFSVWNADKASGRNCSIFSGEGSGWTCRIDPFTPVPDREYIVRVTKSATDTIGQWYRGSVKDTVTGVTTTMGRIHVPWTGTAHFRGWVSWTEYFATPPARCAEMPRSRAQFRYPTANDSTVRIAGHTNEVAPGECRASITDLTNRVRHRYPN